MILLAIILSNCSKKCFFYSSESSDTSGPACPPRYCGQHLWGIHQIASDLLPESSGVCASVPQPFPGVYSAARSVPLIPSVAIYVCAKYLIALWRWSNTIAHFSVATCSATGDLGLSLGAFCLGKISLRPLVVHTLWKHVKIEQMHTIFRFQICQHHLSDYCSNVYFLMLLICQIA